ncbi:MAG: gamma-glutamylcyclotransferase [Myxococcales bacterium]|nr:gamma-glutamylcyclotransferase [Myxococcales bacterium]
MIGARRVTLFVYGTLLRGEANHHQLGAAELLGPARTEPAYTLLDLGDYPGLRAGGRASVCGELYAVDARQLPALDEFEGLDEYAREPVALVGGGRALAYVLRPELSLETAALEIPSGDWRRR